MHSTYLSFLSDRASVDHKSNLTTSNRQSVQIKNDNEMSSIFILFICKILYEFVYRNYEEFVFYILMNIIKNYDLMR